MRQWRCSVEQENDEILSEISNANDHPTKDCRGRGDKEFKITVLLSKSNQEIFENGLDIEKELDISSQGISLEHIKRFKDRRELYGKVYCTSRTDQDLFESGDDTPNIHVKRTQSYVKRKNRYCERYCQDNFDGKSCQYILCAMSETPKLVRESQVFKDKIKHLSKVQMSEMTALHEARKTIARLRENLNKEARYQIKVISSSLTSTEHGPPDLGLHPRDKKEVVEMKEKLMTGQEKILKIHTKPPRQVFPPKVKEVGINYWEQITVTDPAKHRYAKKAVRDNEETVPTRLQTMTDKECYDGFESDCKDEIKIIMSKHAASQLEVLAKRPETQDKQNRINHATNVLPNKFPGQTWFIEIRPPEIKLMHDHTTGLCKVIVSKLELWLENRCVIYYF